MDVTLHFLHILQQYARGYFTGVNAKRWKHYLLASKCFFKLLIVGPEFSFLNIFYFCKLFY